MSSIDLSIVIPCYNEGPTLEKSVARIIKALDQLGKRWEIIFVEDGSTDGTKETVAKLVKKIANAKAIFHGKNEGRGKAVADGIRASQGSICGFLDVDLEVAESYIPIFTREIEEGAQMVIGRRFYEKGGSAFFRFVASKIYALIAKFLLRLPFSDTEAGFKFFNRSAILPIVSKVKDKGWFWDTEICARAFWMGLKISQIPVLFVRRADKKSTVRMLPDTWNYLFRLIRFRIENNDRYK